MGTEGLKARECISCLGWLWPGFVLMLWFTENAVGFLNCSLCADEALRCCVGIQFPKAFTEALQG